MLVVTQIFNLAVKEFGPKKSASCNRVLIVTELVLSGTQAVE